MSVHDLTELLAGKRIAILTGAGCSTESGIPDYRGEGTLARARNPIQHREFMQQEATRKRYWARSTIGWPRMSRAEPNAAHRAIAELEALGRTTGVITQNVDRLHHKAGSRNVLELHGALADVRCTACGERESREALQHRILELNPTFADADSIARFRMAPDGDAELEDATIDDFHIPPCAVCRGVLKPDVVFFGGSVPRERVDAAFAILDAADVLLVVGSSLAVFSGFRFVLRARDRGMPIAIINRGPSRGDEHARVRVDANAGDVLPQCVPASALAGASTGTVSILAGSAASSRNERHST